MLPPRPPRSPPPTQGASHSVLVVERLQRVWREAGCVMQCGYVMLGACGQLHGLQPGCWREPATRAATRAARACARQAERSTYLLLHISPPPPPSCQLSSTGGQKVKPSFPPPHRWRKMGCWLSGVKGWNPGGRSSLEVSETMAGPRCKSIKFTHRFVAPLP